MNIRLPNGKIMRGVPDGTSRQQIMEHAIAKGYATQEDFAGNVSADGSVDLSQNNQPQPQQEPAAEQPQQAAPAVEQPAPPQAPVQQHKRATSVREWWNNMVNPAPDMQAPADADTRPSLASEYQAQLNQNSGATKQLDDKTFEAAIDAAMQMPENSGKPRAAVATELRGKTAKELAEIAAMTATLGVSAPIGIAKLAAQSGALTAAPIIAGQAAESIVTGENKFDAKKVAGDSTVGAGLGGTLGIAAKGVPYLLNARQAIKQQLGKALSGERALSDEGAKAAQELGVRLTPADMTGSGWMQGLENTVAEVPFAGIKQQREANISKVVNAVEDKSAKASEKAQSTRNRMADAAKKAQDNANNLQSKMKPGDLNDAYRAKVAAANAEELGALSTKTTDELVKDVVPTVIKSMKTKASAEYDRALGMVDQELKKSPLDAYKVLGLNGTRKAVENILKEEQRLGTLSIGVASEMQGLQQFKPQSVEDLNKLKVRFNELSADAYDNNKAASRIFKSVANSIKSDIDKGVGELSGRTVNVYKKADKQYRDAMEITDSRFMQSFLKKEFSGDAWTALGSGKAAPEKIAKFKEALKASPMGKTLTEETLQQKFLSDAVTSSTTDRAAGMNLGAFSKFVKKHEGVTNELFGSKATELKGLSNLADALRNADVQTNQAMSKLHQVGWGIGKAALATTGLMTGTLGSAALGLAATKFGTMGYQKLGDYMLKHRSDLIKLANEKLPAKEKQEIINRLLRYIITAPTNPDEDKNRNKGSPLTL